MVLKNKLLLIQKIKIHYAIAAERYIIQDAPLGGGVGLKNGADAGRWLWVRVLAFWGDG